MSYKPWINCGVEGWIRWPDHPATVKFDDKELRLLPPDEEHYASIHVRIESSRTSEEEGYTRINRYLSFRSWSEDQPVEVRFSWLGSGQPVPVLRGNRPRQLVPMAPASHSSSENGRHLLALGLFREARSVNSVPYSFLGYFKILNIFWKEKFRNRSSAIVDGIRQSLGSIQDERARRRIEAISATESDVASYLYRSGRCAVAHANVDPTVDPDEAAELLRLKEDLCIVKAIAECLIETEFGVSRSSQRY